MWKTSTFWAKAGWQKKHWQSQSTVLADIKTMQFKALSLLSIIVAIAIQQAQSQEIFWALDLESKMSKEEILEKIKKGEYKKSLELTINSLNRIEPGIYEIKAEFTGHPFYHEIPSMTAKLIINQSEMKCEDGECKIKSSLYGFEPNSYLKHIEIDHSEYSDLDLSNLGSYREVKSGFRLTLYSKEHSVLDIKDEIVIEIKLSEELNKSDVLEVYEYSSSGISKIDSNRSNGSISFSVSSLNSDFLLIGMRETYSYGDNWKIGIIVMVAVVFIGTIFIAKKVHKKNRFKI